MDGWAVGHEISLRMSGSNKVKHVQFFFPCKTSQGLYYAIGVMNPQEGERAS